MTTNISDKLPPLLVWDVDDVLNNLTGEWFEEYTATYPSSITYAQLTENPPNALLGMKMQEYLASLDDFRNRKMIQLKPVDEVHAWFNIYGNNFHHAALTATPFKFAADSAQWVIRNFGTWIRSFHFIPSARPEDNIPIYHRNKAELLQSIGTAVILIDDNETNLVQAELLGIPCRAFPRPWNRNRKMSIRDFLRKLTVLAEQTLPAK